MAVHCFVWPPALQLWSGRKAGRQVGNVEENSKSIISLLKKNLYLTACVFMF